MLMKIRYASLLVAAAVTMAATSLFAQSSTVLEGFEQYTNDVSLPGMVGSPDLSSYVELWTTWGGRASSGQVTVSVYTATSPGDPRVTEGTNSIALTFFADGFGNDLGVLLNEVATAA